MIMQGGALPYYNTFLSAPLSLAPPGTEIPVEFSLRQEDPAVRRLGVSEMVSKNAVVVFSRRGCCMSHVIRRLLVILGVNPVIFEVDEEDIRNPSEFESIGGGDLPEFPFMVIGGRLFGGLDKVITAHVSGDLVPLLKHAGTLWL